MCGRYVVTRPLLRQPVRDGSGQRVADRGALLLGRLPPISPLHLGTSHREFAHVGSLRSEHVVDDRVELASSSARSFPQLRCRGGIDGEVGFRRERLEIEMSRVSRASSGRASDSGATEGAPKSVVASPRSRSATSMSETDRGALKPRTLPASTLPASTPA